MGLTSLCGLGLGGLSPDPAYAQARVQPVQPSVQPSVQSGNTRRPLVSQSKSPVPVPAPPSNQGRPKNTPVGGAIQFYVPPPPAGQRRPPGSRWGGATRSNCPFTPQDLVALVPGSDRSSDSTGTTGANSAWAGGQTFSDRPTLWFRVPAPLTWNNPGRFRLADDKGNALLDDKGKPYQLWVQTKEGEAGVVAVRLPVNWPTLAVGKTYKWTFTIFCGEDPASSVQGDIQRVALEAGFSQRLQQASPREQVRLLAQQGIWFEALTQLAQQRLASPQDLQVLKDWQEFLTSVGLGDVAGVPVIQPK